jgi:hypothetical protein
VKRQKENAIFYSPGGCDIHDDLVCRFICGASVRYSLARELTPGTDPGAPIAPKLLAKFAWTTLISAGVFAAVAALRNMPVDGHLY